MYPKLQELMLYIAQKSQGDPSFGYIKLNKVLFYADFYAYGELGQSITGATYIRNRLGPTPREIKPAERELEHTERARVVEADYFGRRQKRLVPLDDPDLTLFSESELDLVNRVLYECRDSSGTQLSNQTHELLPWLSSTEGEVIPYEAVFTLRKMPVGFEDHLWADQVLEEMEEAGELEFVNG
jgi:hypothetical protein